MLMKFVSVLFFLFIFSDIYPQKGIWTPDNGDGSYTNPVIYADYSDPDVIRVGDDYFLTASSFVNTPGLPVLHSKDLVNWEIINYAVKNIPYGKFDIPMRGNGIWAPSIRFHKGEYYIYFGDPDYGIFMTKTRNPYEKWEPLKLVKEAKGWIDACPFWDEDGNAYLVHAWAKSRSGIKGILTLNRMSPDGEKILDEGIKIFDGTEKNPTTEGPKLYKRNGYYYILAPAGGVTSGWQLALRAKNIYGPYEEKIVLAQGKTEINGPHQGGWVESPGGESWFLHFQDKGAFGRIVHLQPVKWENGWPIMGSAGEPVERFKKPFCKVGSTGINLPGSDEFNRSDLSLQWQWEANHSDEWYNIKEGKLRLYSVPIASDSVRLWNIPNILGQKFPGPDCTITTKLSFCPKSEGESTGIIILGMDYCFLSITSKESGFLLSLTICMNADNNGKEKINWSKRVESGEIFLRVSINNGGNCIFSFSTEGNRFENIDYTFPAKKGKWVGAKIGIFSTAPYNCKKTGFTDYDWFKFNGKE